jgi:predicted dehydrogenase
VTPVKLGIIGAGGVASLHLRTLRDVPEVAVVAVADVVQAAATRAAAEFGISDSYTDYHELLARDDIEGVMVCTPTAVHAPPVIAALEAGKHVFVEKPMEANLQAAARMVAAAEAADRILMVGLKLRFTRQLQLARRIVAEGALGNIYYAEAVAYRRRGMPGGSFLRKETAGFGASADIGVYAIDSALYVMGFPTPVAISATTSKFLADNAKPVYGQWTDGPVQIEVEDFAAAWVRFDNGCRMVIKTAWNTHIDSLGGTFFLGERAGLRIGVGEVTGTEEGVSLHRDEYGAMGDQRFLNVADADNEDVFAAEERAFAAAIRSGGPSPVDAHEALLTNVIIQGIIDSADAGGREVELRVPELR